MAVTAALLVAACLFVAANSGALDVAEPGEAVAGAVVHAPALPVLDLGGNTTGVTLGPGAAAGCAADLLVAADTVAAAAVVAIVTALAAEFAFAVDADANVVAAAGLAWLAGVDVAGTGALTTALIVPVDDMTTGPTEACSFPVVAAVTVAVGIAAVAVAVAPGCVDGGLWFAATTAGLLVPAVLGPTEATSAFPLAASAC